MNENKVIALGLEAAEIKLINKWINEGELPAFNKIMKNGCWRKLMSTTEISSGATWASINTGVSPAKHGMGFYHRQLKTGTYRIIKKYADMTGYPLFWEKLSTSKIKSVVFDIPDIYLLKNFNGTQVIGWGAEGLNFKQSSQPPELLNEIFSKIGHHPLEGWYQKEIDNVDEWIELKKKLIDGVKFRTSVIKFLLQKENWDFFFAGYAELHWAGHYFWHLTDNKNPRYKPDIAKVCGDAIFQVYKEIDNALNELLNLYPTSTILIFSNTGMGANYSGIHLVPEILKRLRLDGSNDNDKKNILTKFSPAKRWGPYSIKKIEDIVSAEIIEKIKKILPEKLWDNWTRKFLTAGNNWKNSKVFTVPSDYTATLRINLKGREPNGIVNPGKEYEELCEEIKKHFLELINPAAGKKAVKEVIIVRDIYSGKYIDDLPDIVIKWEGENPIQSLYSPAIGTVSGELPDKRSGAHTTYGFIMASGNQVKSSGELPEKNIMDIAPTVLNLFNIPPDSDMDGVILNDMFEQEEKQKKKILHHSEK